jgi:hypothetical protein
MKNLSLVSLLGLSLLAVACKNGEGNDSGDGDQHPQQTEWKKVVDLPFPLSGDGKVTSISIGRLDYDGNFANRGDVEVYFDNQDEKIQIEMRVYDFTDDISANGDEAAGVKGTLERMSLWAYVTTSNPAKPSEMDVEDDCTKDTWKSGCAVYVYYDGQTQPVRMGADLRVHLPKAYRGSLDIETEDNDDEPSYPLVSDVIVEGLCGSADIKMSQGEAKIKMCRELTPAPTCSAEAIKECEDFEIDGQPAAWSNLCTACPAENFGQVKIEAVKPWAGNITVDIPTTTWLNANLANEETDRPHMCKPELSACTDAGGSVCTLNEDGTGYGVAGEFNYPSPAAASGAGFNLTVKSAGCGPVKYYESPDDWSAESEPKEEEHGHIKVCTGCL